MDVTQEIIEKANVYGGTGFTNVAQTAPSRTLQFAPGASIHKPEKIKITKVPLTLEFKDAVGYGGVDNTFYEIELDIVDEGTDRIEQINSYQSAQMTPEPDIDVNTYETGYVNAQEDNEVVNDYEPTLITFRKDLAKFPNPRITIDLENLKTGNQYIDSWVDIRLYEKNKDEHEYDKLILKLKDKFYIGFHARNTRRLPYNVECRIADEYLDGDNLTSEQRRFLPSS